MLIDPYAQLSQDPPPERPLWGGWIKILIALLLIMVPLAATMVGGVIAVSRKQASDYDRQYRLPPYFQWGDMERIGQSMKGAREFAFYFLRLPPEEVEGVLRQAYGMLDGARDQKAHREVLRKKQDEVGAMAALFEHIDFPRDFGSRPDDYPDLTRRVNTFIREEFLLTVIGVAYKFTYDRRFQFSWDDEVRDGVARMYQTLTRPVSEGSESPAVLPDASGAPRPE